MTTQSLLRYHMAPTWKVTQTGDTLILHGGADAEYEVALLTDAPSRFTKQAGDFARDELTAADQAIFDQLVLAGVIKRKKAPSKKILRVALIGDALPIEITSQRIRVVDIADADIVLVGRYTSWHGEVIQKIDYYHLDTPHLYIDLAYHHTISIGPLVYPGETACIGCLYGRLRERWGDEKPPRRPNTAAYTPMIRTWVEHELGRIADGDTGLAGKTVSWDMDTRVMQTDVLLRSTACPRCGVPCNDGGIPLE